MNFTLTGDPVNDNFVADNLTVTLVPEPGFMMLLPMAAGCALLTRRRVALA